MTSKNDWDPSMYNDVESAADLCIQQFPSTPIEVTGSFYDVEGNISAHRIDYCENYVVSDASSTSSGSRRKSYCYLR